MSQPNLGSRCPGPLGWPYKKAIAGGSDVTTWEQIDLTPRILDILGSVPRQEGHHLGYPFLSNYQIAIEFALRYPSDFEAIGMPIGGAGTGEHNSFPQYIGRELSRRCREELRDRIEGGFFSDQCLARLTFRYRDQLIESSLIGTYDMSVFRLRG